MTYRVGITDIYDWANIIDTLHLHTKKKTQNFSHAFLMKLNYSYCQFLLKTIGLSGKFLKNNEFHRFKFSTFSKSIFQPKNT